LKLTLLPQAEAKGSTVFGLRLKQHRQYLTLVFFFSVKYDFEKGLIEAKEIAIKAEL
jgi:hypothetical protein